MDTHAASTHTGLLDVHLLLAFDPANDRSQRSDRRFAVRRASGCGVKSPWSDDVAVTHIAGIDPRTALVSPVAAYTLYVAEGVSVDELPSDIAELVAP